MTEPTNLAELAVASLKDQRLSASAKTDASSTFVQVGISNASPDTGDLSPLPPDAVLRLTIRGNPDFQFPTSVAPLSLGSFAA